MPSLATRLATIEAIVVRLEKHLLGNGQPGLIHELRQADAANQRATKRIQTRLNVALGVVLGVWLVWSTLTGAGAEALQVVLKSVAR